MPSDDSTDPSRNAIVRLPGTDMAETSRRAHPVIARMTRDVLARAEAQGLDLARHRIGDYLLRGPDYRQVSHWAESLGMTPEEVLGHLADSRLDPNDWEYFDGFDFVVEDGAIRSLVWDFGRLPRVPEPWRQGLLIRALGFMGKWPSPPAVLRVDLPQLQILCCAELGLTELDLSPVPRLTELYCYDNQLTELDLSPVPGLTLLSCSNNRLTELDLSPAPGLTWLDCGSNPLTELDLSPVPGLTELHCWSNQLTELDLSPVPGLTVLHCYDNQLTELDLSPVPGVTRLNCSGNPLTELDLSPVPGLTRLECDRSLRLHNPPAGLKVERK